MRPSYPIHPSHLPRSPFRNNAQHILSSIFTPPYSSSSLYAFNEKTPTHSLLLQVVDDELSTGGLDDPPPVGGGVVRLSLSEGDSLGHFRSIWVVVELSKTVVSDPIKGFGGVRAGAGRVAWRGQGTEELPISRWALQASWQVWHFSPSQGYRTYQTSNP